MSSGEGTRVHHMIQCVCVTLDRPSGDGGLDGVLIVQVT